MLAPILGKDPPKVEGCDLADLLLRDSPEAAGDSVGRRERMEDTSSSSSLVEVELVERITTTSTPEDAVARYVLTPFHYSPFHHPQVPGLLGARGEGGGPGVRDGGRPPPPPPPPPRPQQPPPPSPQAAGLWGHALFLASKMDQRTYAMVMTRCAVTPLHHYTIPPLHQVSDQFHLQVKVHHRFHQ